MKKSLLILALALVFTFALGTMAMAAQKLAPNYVTGDGVNDYAATPENTTSPYPNGLYLPSRDSGTIHSAYQRNTDACAACHATHTAVGAGALLQWKNNQDTCDACHDGTVTNIYNVTTGKIGTTGAMTWGGLFGGVSADDSDGNATSLSRHDVLREGQVTGSPIAGLPGGSPDGIADPKGTWEGQFTCVSCHDPHGRLGNFRILSPNVNGVAELGKISNEAVAVSTDGAYYLKNKNLLTGHGVDPVVLVGGTEMKPYVTNGTTGETTFNYVLDSKAGKITFTNAPTGAVLVTYTPGIKVEGKVTDKLLATEKVDYISGMSNFCGACHTDYNATRAQDPISKLYGVYTQAYRHPMGPSVRYYAVGVKGEGATMDALKLSCLGCHVAHGTDKAWWDSWKIRSGWKGQVSSEDAGSSALKRLPNMSTCEACHRKGENNQFTPTDY